MLAVMDASSRRCNCREKGEQLGPCGWLSVSVVTVKRNGFGNQVTATVPIYGWCLSLLCSWSQPAAAVITGGLPPLGLLLVVQMHVGILQLVWVTCLHLMKFSALLYKADCLRHDFPGLNGGLHVTQCEDVPEPWQGTPETC